MKLSIISLSLTKQNNEISLKDITRRHNSIFCSIFKNIMTLDISILYICQTCWQNNVQWRIQDFQIEEAQNGMCPQSTSQQGKARSPPLLPGSWGHYLKTDPDPIAMV